jgi:beta-fructofuranosidase
MLSLPREVSLEEGRLATRPARELQGLRGELCDEYVGTSKGATLANVPGAFELWLRLERPARKVSLALELGRDEVFSVFLDREGGRVIVDSDKASADARAHGGVTAIDSVGRLLEQDTVELRWFIDHSVSELFVADRVVATNRLFPVSEGPWRLRLTASETSGMEARLWALRNILTPGTDRAKPA